MNLKADMKKLYAAGLLGMAVCTSLAYSDREKKGLSLLLSMHSRR